ncbi:MAG: class I SAM-dependent methyltransferase [Acidobacteria bacterium]|nr:class I SAM-dependent methyltransferase [Acidobacteriota bacterium]
MLNETAEGETIGESQHAARRLRDYRNEDYRDFWKGDRKALLHDMEAGVVAELAPKEPGWFFDVGAGHGRLLPLYAREDRRIVLVDYAMNLLQTAKSSNDKGNIHYVVADAYHLPFRPETFSGGLSIRAFHHMEDPGAFLAELARVTRAGAEILVEYSNKRNLLRVLRRGAAAFRREHECYSGMLFGTHPAHFERLCRDAGLRVVMNRGLGSFERLWKSGRFPTGIVRFAERFAGRLLGPMGLEPLHFSRLRKTGR